MTEQTKKSGVWTVILVLFVLVIVLCIVVYSFNNVGSSTVRPRATSPPVTYEVNYRITGTTDRASLTYQNETGDTEQVTVSVPWNKRFQVSRGTFAYISAQNERDHGTITCEIMVNGQVWKQANSSGAYAIASCSGSVGRE